MRIMRFQKVVHSMHNRGVIIRIYNCPQLCQNLASTCNICADKCVADKYVVLTRGMDED